MEIRFNHVSGSAACRPSFLKQAPTIRRFCLMDNKYRCVYIANTLRL